MSSPSGLLPRIFQVGDSISIQYGPFLQERLRGIAIYSQKGGQKFASRNFDIPRGANGGDSGMVAAFLRKKVNRKTPLFHLIVINCGLHDIKRDPISYEYQVPVETYRKNLVRIINSATKLAKKTCWIRTTPVDDEIHNRLSKGFFRFSSDCQKYNEIADEVMRDFRVPSIDLYTFTVNIPGDKYYDHVHFVESVRQQQAEYVFDSLVDLLRE